MVDVELSDLPLTSYVFEHAQRGARATAGFAAYRLTEGDLVVLWIPNRPELVIAYYAVLAAGGVVTTVNPMATGAELAGELARSCADRLGCRIKQGYGMTELGGASHLAPDTGRDDPESSGPALPGVQCRVVDSVTGADVGSGEQGELLIRTPGVMRGYLNDPAAGADTIDPDGWLGTGDLVVQDVEGWFRVVDRRKELIKCNAYRVAPAELEGVLLTHPAVAAGAVIASPDERSGEVPKAFVVLSSSASAEELLNFVADRVSPYKRIMIVEFIDEIPKSPSGKILRRVLVERDRALIASAR